MTTETLIEARRIRFRALQTLLRYIERAFLTRHPSVAQRVALALTRLARPGVLRTRETLRRHLNDRVRVSIRAYGDHDPDQYRRLRMGDTWVKQGLVVALGQAGFIVTDCDPDVAIHLHGEETHLPDRAIKVLWVHSHPEKITSSGLARYDHVFCASQTMAARARALGSPATALELATSLQPRSTSIKHEVVFVGNARPGGSRAVIDQMGTPDFGLKIWGGGYVSLPQGSWMGDYLEYADLPELYASSVISLNDHLPSMAESGIVTPRIYDILASGGFCISDANPGINEVFGDAVPQYRTSAELRSLIKHFLAHPDERLKLMAAGQKIALESTWPDRARALMAPITDGPEYESFAGSQSRRRAP